MDVVRPSVGRPSSPGVRRTSWPSRPCPWQAPGGTLGTHGRLGIRHAVVLGGSWGVISYHPHLPRLCGEGDKGVPWGTLFGVRGSFGIRGVPWVPSGVSEYGMPSCSGGPGESSRTTPISLGCAVREIGGYPGGTLFGVRGSFGIRGVPWVPSGVSEYGMPSCSGGPGKSSRTTPISLGCAVREIGGYLGVPCSGSCDVTGCWGVPGVSAYRMSTCSGGPRESLRATPISLDCAVPEIGGYLGVPCGDLVTSQGVGVYLASWGVVRQLARENPGRCFVPRFLYWGGWLSSRGI